MNITLFGATGDLGRECLGQCLEAGHRVTALVRDPSKLSEDLRRQVTLVQGNALDAGDVARTIIQETDAVLFAIGIDSHSPEDLCTDATRHILAAMRAHGVKRFVWCGGGSTHVPDDVVTFGSRFVGWFAAIFMGLRHRDKDHQIALLEASRDIEWIGIRPLQMKAGLRRERYRVGFHAFSGLSSITFADCAHAMVGMLSDDTWTHKAPIIQY